MHKGVELRLAGLLLLPLTACGGGDVEPPMTDALAFVTTSLPGTELGAGYDVKLEATGGTVPYEFSIAAGELPTGIELKRNSGQISGTAGSPGTHQITARVKDAAGDEVTKDLTIFVQPEPLTIVTAALDEAYTMEVYAFTLQAEGGVPQIAWTVAEGSLASGMVLATDGRIAGTPTEAGVFTVTVQAEDAEGSTIQKELMLTVRPGSPMIETDTLPAALLGERYEVRLEGSGGHDPLVWSVATGTVPAGLTLQDDGLLFGTPTEAAMHEIAVRVTDDVGNADEKVFPLLVIEPLSVSTRTLPIGVLDEPYSFQLEAEGGLAPYAWSTTDTLPSGVTLSEQGLLAGTPTEVGEWNIRVRVQDALQGVPRSARLILRVQDVRIYEVEPNLAFPPVCTSTIVSYQTVEIPVPGSYAIQSINVEVDVDFTDSDNNNNSKLKLVLFAPNGRRSVLCGNGAGVRGSSGCNGSGGIQVTYGDLNVGPQRPFRAFVGMNAQGTWRFQAAVAKPTTSGGNCEQAGTINRVAITMEPDISSDPYIVVTGFTYHNLLIDPWLRITGGGLDQDEIFLAATLWNPGANGRREGGLGDDQPDPVQFTWSGNGLPMGTTIAPDGRVQSGSLTSGPASMVTAQDTTGTYSITLPLAVVAPDWNPLIRNY